jgi:hypothetical protein
MDLVNALLIKSWIETAKAEAAKRGCRVYLNRVGGGFEIVEDRPAKPTAEIYPGGRVIVWEQ